MDSSLAHGQVNWWTTTGEKDRKHTFSYYTPMCAISKAPLAKHIAICYTGDVDGDYRHENPLWK